MRLKTALNATPNAALAALLALTLAPSIRAEESPPQAPPQLPPGAPAQAAKETLPTVADDHPVRLDRTGIRWVLPYERAQATARKTKHPMLIKAVAFGTTKSGCW